MYQVILSAREMHGCGSVKEYNRLHETEIARAQARGLRLIVHDSHSLVARIDHGRWIVDCECGAGNATDPEWGVAFCFACGARHKATFPDDREGVEAVLLHRPRTETRNWFPGESVAQLQAENVEHGLEA